MPGGDRDTSADPGTGDDGELDTVISGCRSSHERLVSTVSGFDEAAVRGPSRLDGWTIGHIVTHLARNADSHTRMLNAAAQGEAVEQYAGGREERASRIESGAARSAQELLEDMLRSMAELESAWATMTPLAWDRHGLSRGHPWPCRTMPYFRWREVEIHHVDMGTGYEPEQWPEEYVARELPHLLATVPERLEDGAQRRRLLSWLTGRAPSAGDLDLGPWESRPGNYFRGLSS
jgi:maleylpyruvate isomerase